MSLLIDDQAGQSTVLRPAATSAATHERTFTSCRYVAKIVLTNAVLEGSTTSIRPLGR